MTLARALALLLLVATHARADDGPMIERVEPSEFEPGSTITMHGRGLHACPALPEADRCRHDEMAVRIGFRDLPIVECSAERVVVRVPDDMPAGRGRLVVQLRDRGRASIAVEVVDLLATPPPPGWEAAAQRLRERFVITRFAPVQEAGGMSFVIEGRAPAVLADMRVHGYVELDTPFMRVKRVEGWTAHVTSAGTFAARVGPWTRAVPAGSYTTVARFHRDLLQRRDLVRALRRAVSAQDFAGYAWLERRASLQVGTPDDAARARAEVLELDRARFSALSALATEADRWRAAHALSRLRLPFGAVAPRFDRRACAAWIAMALRDVARSEDDERAFDARWAFQVRGSDDLALLTRAAISDLAERVGVAHPGLQPVIHWRSQLDAERARLGPR